MNDVSLSILNGHGALPLTFEHLRCWREDLHVRPVGDAVRVVNLKLSGLSEDQVKPRTDAWLWVLG